MSIAIITTISTAGYLLYMLLITFYLLNAKPRYFILSSPFVILCGYFLLNSQIIKSKVEDRIENRNKTIENLEVYSKERDAISLGRFGSLVIDINDYINHPIIGFGLQSEERTNNQYIEMVRANGLSDYLVKFGLLGIMLLIYNLRKMELMLKRNYRFRGSFVLVAIVILLSFSNPVLVTPLFLGFQLVGWVLAEKKKPKIISKPLISYG